MRAEDGVRRVSRRILFLFAVLLLGAGAVFPQSNQGEVQIYVFSEDGLPLEGVTTEARGRTYESNTSGLINFTHPPGTHEFVLRYQGSDVATLEIPVRQGQATEAIVTAREGGEAARVDTGQAQELEEFQQADREEIDAEAPGGTLQGTVTDIEDGEPVADATVIFREVDFETRTDEDGRFTAQLPEGVYSFSVIHPDFSTQTRSEVEIAVDEETEVLLELTPAAIQLEEVPVFATEEIRVQGGIANLIDETRNAGVVLNLIGQEQISRSGDSDAAAALRRVTGLTVVDGRFVYVRGMGERYSSAYLNGARLPSPELDRRVVPLDLFPAEVIESMAVQKSYSPDLRGDFGGGAINLRSIGIPDDRYRRRLRTVINTSIGYNIGTTFTERAVEEAGAFDFIGIDDGTRAFPDGFPDERLSLKNPTTGRGNFTEEELEGFAEDLNGRWEPTERLLPLDYSGSVSVRDKIEIREQRSFGFNGAVSYSDSWDWTNRREVTYEAASGGADTAVNTDYDVDQTNRNTDISALLDLAYQHNPQAELKTTSLLVRATDNQVRVFEGPFLDDTLDLFIREQEWVEQTLFNQSVEGTLGLGILNDASLRTQYGFSIASRYEPDHRRVLYSDDNFNGDYEEDIGSLYTRSFAAERWFSTVQDTIHDAEITLTLPIFWFNESADFVDLGAAFLLQQRTTDTRRFVFEATEDDPAVEPDLVEDPDDLFIDDNIGYDSAQGEFITISEETLATDNYAGEHLIWSGFFNTDILLPFEVRMNAGARLDLSRQTVEVVDLFTGFTQEPEVLETLDINPSLNFTWPFADNMQLRVGGSRTVNRPDLQELSPARRFGPPGTGITTGNPDLERATIWNADLRWEMYIAERENLAVGAFYKYFEDPIEQLQFSGASFTTTYTNVPEAYNVGGELEWALQFRFVSDLLRDYMVNLDYASLEREQRARRRLGSVASVFRDLRTTGNVSVIRSRIDYGDEDRGSLTTEERPLQGQSPWVVNASLGYKNSVSWSQQRQTYTSVFFNYNVFGPRIQSLGTVGVPDIYEQPFHELNLVFKHEFNVYFSMGLKVNNILDLPARTVLGEEILYNGFVVDGVEVDEFQKGRSVSISATLDL